jgi:hypothetical protein
VGSGAAEEVLRLPEELARVDALLDDPAFFAAFTPLFDPRLGRPSTPMEVYLIRTFSRPNQLTPSRRANTSRRSAAQTTTTSSGRSS